MRIAIVSIGTLGDIVPYIALGQRFIAAGDQVRIITFKQFEPLIRKAGCDFYPFSGEDLQELLNRDNTQSQISEGKPVRSLSTIARAPGRARKRVEQWMLDTLDACRDADVIIGQMIGHLLALPVAQKLNIPYCSAFVFPLERTRAFPNAFSVFPSAPGWQGFAKGTYNWWTHKVSVQIFRSLIGPVIKKARFSALGVSTRGKEPNYPVLYGYSPTLLPKPREWGERISVTGYWVSEQETAWQPTPELEQFLAAEQAPPVYVGFGSMTGQASRQAVSTVLQALKNLNLRAVLLLDKATWPELELPDSVLCLKSAPHDWLFPRMAAVIHHGGAGTTRAALSAGVPQIIVPFIADQSFWGCCISTFGFGPAPLKHKKMSLVQTQKAILQATTDLELHNRVKLIARQISQENGTENALQIVHDYVDSFRSEQLAEIQKKFAS